MCSIWNKVLLTKINSNSWRCQLPKQVEIEAILLRRRLWVVRRRGAAHNVPSSSFPLCSGCLSKSISCVFLLSPSIFARVFALEAPHCIVFGQSSLGSQQAGRMALGAKSATFSQVLTFRVETNAIGRRESKGLFAAIAPD